MRAKSRSLNLPIGILTIAVAVLLALRASAQKCDNYSEVVYTGRGSQWLLTSQGYSQAFIVSPDAPFSTMSVRGNIPPGLVVERKSNYFTAGWYDSVTGQVTTPGRYQFSSYGYGVWWFPDGDLPCKRAQEFDSALFDVHVIPDFAADGVELSQAIQIAKSPSELYRWLSSTPPEPLSMGDMPVPLVENKAGALRIYFRQIDTPLDARVRITVLPPDGESASDAYVASQDVKLLPGCSPREARLHLQSSGYWCHSLDFDIDGSYFKEGNYQVFVQVAVLDPSFGATLWKGIAPNPSGEPCQPNGPGYLRGHDWYSHGNLIQSSLDDSSGTLEVWSCLYPPFRVNKTDTIVLHPVSICLDQCGDASAISDMSRLLANIAPTSKVTIANGETPLYVPLKPGRDWWLELIGSLEREETIFLPPDEPGTRNFLWGVVHPDAPGPEGGISRRDTRSAASRSSVLRMPPPPPGASHASVETNVGVVAHEFGHLVGLDHTGTDVPGIGIPVSATAPGCYGSGNPLHAGYLQWPYQMMGNQLWSAPGKLEVGLDLTRNRVRGSDFREPDLSFEMMGYCTPRWVTPWSYLALYEGLTPAAAPLAASPLSSAQRHAVKEISGSVTETGIAFDPIFTFETVTTLEQGTGSFRLELRSADGSVLYRKWFTPRAARTETAGEEIVTLPSFSVLVPDLPDLASIAAYDASGNNVGIVMSGGIAPTVHIMTPVGGGTLQGIQKISWTVLDPDSTSHTFWVEYSPDGGDTWTILTNSQDTPAMVTDFDQLPGSNGSGLIRVYASDGLNTGSATSEPFTVAKKNPRARIIQPEDGAVFHVGEVLTLDGSGSDTDDGILGGSALTWSSPTLGPLGTDDRVSRGPLDDRYLGNHTIMLAATDRDGNRATDAVTITVLPKPPIAYPVAPPSVNAGGTYTGEEGSPIAFSSSGSFASDLTPLAYSWNFGDGGTSGAAEPSHTFLRSGDFSVELTVTNQHGQAATATTHAVVSNVPPVVTGGLSVAGKVTRPVNLTASFGGSGPENGPWTVSWAFGDGSASPETTVEAQGTLAISHVYNTSGQFVAVVTVRDKEQAMGSAAVAAAITSLGDVDNSGVVDCVDMAIVRASFGRRTGQAGFDPKADINMDGVVDIRDLYFVSSRLPAGTKCPSR